MEKTAIEPRQLRLWCREQLGAEPEGELFRAGYLSAVVGIHLADGRDVVVKVRPRENRLEGCFEVQRRLFQAGFPCPEPLVGPTPFLRWAASAERYQPGGTVLPRSGRKPELFAEALAALIAAAPARGEVATLDPPPPWAAWKHQGPGLWPWPDDRDIDLNAVEGPPWLDDVGAAGQLRLSDASGPLLVGHGDFYAGNLRWNEDQLYVVHDWDSVITAPETVIVGLAAAVFPATGGPAEEATVDETRDFLAAYEQFRGTAFSASEAQETWAAGLWVRAFDAKKQFATAGVIDALQEREATTRRRHAGI